MLLIVLLSVSQVFAQGCVFEQQDCNNLFGVPDRGFVLCNVTSCNQQQIVEVQGRYGCDSGLRVGGDTSRSCTFHSSNGNTFWSCSGAEPICSIGKENCPEHASFAYHFLCYDINTQRLGSEDSASSCIQSGGRLAEIHNYGLDEVILNKANEVGITKLWVHSAPGAETRECTAFERYDYVWSLIEYAGTDCLESNPFICQTFPNDRLAAVHTCGLLPHPTHGTRHGSDTQIGSTVSFTCQPGFGLDGDSNRTCLENGLWSGRQPTCEAHRNCSMSRRQCEQLFGVPAGGAVSCEVTRCVDRTHPVEVVGHYSCDGSLRLDGSISRKCTKLVHKPEFQYWSCPASLPVCSIPRDFCPHSNHLSFGNLCYDIKRGPQTRTFAENDCQKVGGQLARIDNNQVFTFIKGNSDLMGIFHLWLESFVNLVSGQPSSDESCPALEKDRAASTWSLNALVGGRCDEYKGYVCQYQPTDFDFVDHCATLPTPINGNKIGEDNDLGKTVRFTCNYPYYLNGSQTRLCLSSGLWSGVEAKCLLNDCGHPPHVPNGHASYTATTSGSVARYTCAEGYKAAGETELTCSVNGTWSGQIQQCESHAVKSLHQTVSWSSPMTIGIIAALVLIAIVLLIVIICVIKKRQKRGDSSPNYVVQFSSPSTSAQNPSSTTPSPPYDYEQGAVAFPSDAGPTPAKYLPDDAIGLPPTYSSPYPNT